MLDEFQRGPEAGQQAACPTTETGSISCHYTFKGHLLHLTSNQTVTGYHVQLCSSCVETSISNELLPHPTPHIPEGCSVH